MRTRKPTRRGHAFLYRNGVTWLHRAPAGVKLVAMVVYSSLLFASNGWPFVASALAVAFLTHLCASRSLGLALRDARAGLVQTVVLTSLAGLCLWSVDGLLTGFVVGVKIIALCLAYGAVILTTSPSDMHRALGRVLPERWAWLAVVAIQLVPTLCREFAAVVEAQRSRGWQVRARDLRRPKRVAEGLLIPALVRTVRLSDTITCVALTRGVLVEASAPSPAPVPLSSAVTPLDNS